MHRCARRGEWRFFCSEHSRQPIRAMYGLLFTVVAGSLTLVSFCKQKQSVPVQNSGVALSTPSASVYSKGDPPVPSPAPSIANQGSLKDAPSQPAQVTITGYLVDNYFGDVEHFGMLEGKVGDIERDDEIGPMNKIRLRLRVKMLEPRSMRSGYSIAYDGPAYPNGSLVDGKVPPSTHGGTLRLDRVGNGLAKTILTFSTKSAGVRVEVTGQEINNRFKVSSIKEVEQ